MCLDVVEHVQLCAVVTKGIDERTSGRKYFRRRLSNGYNRWICKDSPNLPPNDSTLLCGGIAPAGRTRLTRTHGWRTSRMRPCVHAQTQDMCNTLVHQNTTHGCTGEHGDDLEHLCAHLRILLGACTMRKAEHKFYFFVHMST